MKQAAMQNSATQNIVKNSLQSFLRYLVHRLKDTQRVILKFPQYDCTHLLWCRRKDITAKSFCMW